MRAARDEDRPRRSRRIHKNAVSKAAQQRKDGYKCKCGATLSTRQSLTRHLQTALIHRSRKRNAVQPPPPPKPVCRPAPDPATLPSALRRSVQDFTRNGFTVCEHVLSKDQIRQCRTAVFETFNRAMGTVQRLSLQKKLEEIGFTKFKMRSAGRFDLEIDQFSEDDFSYLHRDAPWRPLVEAILGPDAILAHTGVMLSMPDSVTQPWHSDGDHLHKRTHLPPHCLNVFVPLIPLTRENGTELVPTSHRQGQYDVDREPLVPELETGDIFLFDFRLRHRGLGNRGRRPRPVVYLQYCLPSFKDTMNFSVRRYLVLPDLPPEHRRHERNSDESNGDTVAEGEGEGEGEREGEEEEEVTLWDSDESDGEQVEDEPEEKLSLVERQRIARAEHRMRAATAPRMAGFVVYTGAPLLVDDGSGNWYPGVMKRVEITDTKVFLRVHYVGWSTRHDFSCTLDSPRIRPAGVEVTIGTGALGPVCKYRRRK